MSKGEGQVPPNPRAVAGSAATKRQLSPKRSVMKKLY